MTRQLPPDEQLKRLARILGRRAARDVARRGSEHEVAAYLSAAQVAHHLGISLRTVRRWISSGALPSTRIGGTRRVAIADLEGALSGQRDLTKRPP